MKALHLLQSLKHGGGENVAYNYSRIMKILGIDSIFVGERDSDIFENMLSETGLVRYKISLRMIKEADIIFVHTNANLLKICLFKLLPLCWKRKKVIFIQHLNITEKKFCLLSKFINFSCTNFIQITPFTKELVDKYIKVKVNFIVNFYLAKHKKEEWEKIRKSVRQECCIPDNKTVVMFSAALKPGKNVADFVELARQSQHDNRFIFLLAGDGIESNYVKEYKGKNLVWLGNVNDVERYLIASDIYVFTSKKEMMPMALLEAINTCKYIMAYDIPVSKFLLKKTYSSLSYDLLLNYKQLPNGAFLNQYDESYAIKEIKKLLEI